MTYVSCFYHAFSGAQKVSWGGRTPRCCGCGLALCHPRITTICPHTVGAPAKHGTEGPPRADVP